MTYVLIRALQGKAREISWLLWVIAAAFVLYFAMDPISQLLGMR